jgi:hypothetical protein
MLKQIKLCASKTALVCMKEHSGIEAAVRLYVL